MRAPDIGGLWRNLTVFPSPPTNAGNANRSAARCKMNDVERLLSIIHEAPLPFKKTDSQLVQEYRNWFYGVRSDRLKAAEQSVQRTVLTHEKDCASLVTYNTKCDCGFDESHSR